MSHQARLDRLVERDVRAYGVRSIEFGIEMGQGDLDVKPDRKPKSTSITRRPGRTPTKGRARASD